MIYRFKVVMEDPDDVIREIEIRSGQTFEDFHAIIQQAFSFDNKHEASFYMSDSAWKKGMEITLKKEAGDTSEKKLMNKVKMLSCIDDPHQRILYLFDFSAQWSFHIELIKILDEDPKESYPRITKSSGIPPKQYNTIVVPLVVEEDDDMEEDELDKKEKIFHNEEGLDAEDDDIDDMLLEGEDDADPSAEEEAPEEGGSSEEEHHEE